METLAYAVLSCAAGELAREIVNSEVEEEN